MEASLSGSRLTHLEEYGEASQRRRAGLAHGPGDPSRQEVRQRPYLRLLMQGLLLRPLLLVVMVRVLHRRPIDPRRARPVP